MTDWMSRPNKANARFAAFAEVGCKRSALLLPAAQAGCIQAGSAAGVLVPGLTDLLLVERDPGVAAALRSVMPGVWAGTWELEQAELSDVDLVDRLDYAFLDFNGTLTSPVVDWLRREFVPALSEGADFALTLAFCRRNNLFYKEYEENLRRHHYEEYLDLADRFQVWDAHITPVIAVLLDVFRGREFTWKRIYRYYDQTPMVLYRIHRIQTIIRQHGVVMKKQISVRSAAAFKAHETRRANGWVHPKTLAKQEEEERRLRRSEAARKAHVTRRERAAH